MKDDIFNNSDSLGTVRHTASNMADIVCQQAEDVTIILIPGCIHPQREPPASITTILDFEALIEEVLKSKILYNKT